MLFATLALPALAQGEKPQCTKGGIGSHYLVPNAEAAKEIYRAVVKAIVPWNLKRFPVVVVDDAGDRWEVSQTDNRPPPKLNLGEVIISAGGGMLNLEIDKCIGGISNAALAR